jgi:hypothetical protein
MHPSTHAHTDRYVVRRTNNDWCRDREIIINMKNTLRNQFFQPTVRDHKDKM